ncbi:putative inactive peptidyl-prolyl cis-trans isomerase-like 6 isoform 5-T5 [Anomaloglossus baeobatrachus]|uniref:putative inactive peptidyl-prolyl cis-trans isomerase-like 6 isoform X5 n=1 Tax=Anomaloglossus baeobatrachus TaxID=238106 RepID=UPI003F5042FC
MAPEQQQIEVVGLLSEPPFHVAKFAAEVLKHSFDAHFEDPVVKPLLQCAWHEYLCTKKKEIKGDVWEFSSHVMCYVNGQFIGDEKALKIWANDTWGYKDYRPLALYKALAEDFYTKYMRSTKLYSDMCPKTCKNFQYLCTGEAGDSKSGLKLHYKGTPFHRIVKNGWVQGGDIASGKGNGGESVFGDTFEGKDENYAVPHNNRGILGMANKGRHSNGSQFYITLQATPYMDRKHVAFGQLIEGSEVLQKMEDIATYNERPRVDCIIVDCGIFTP